MRGELKSVASSRPGRGIWPRAFIHSLHRLVGEHNAPFGRLDPNCAECLSPAQRNNKNNSGWMPRRDGFIGSIGIVKIRLGAEWKQRRQRGETEPSLWASSACPVLYLSSPSSQWVHSFVPWLNHYIQPLCLQGQLLSFLSPASSRMFNACPSDFVNSYTVYLNCRISS